MKGGGVWSGECGAGSVEFGVAAAVAVAQPLVWIGST